MQAQLALQAAEKKKGKPPAEQSPSRLKKPPSELKTISLAQIKSGVSSVKSSAVTEVRSVKSIA
jgi:hypothetical protein